MSEDEGRLGCLWQLGLLLALFLIPLVGMAGYWIGSNQTATLQKRLKEEEQAVFQLKSHLYGSEQGTTMLREKEQALLQQIEKLTKQIEEMEKRAFTAPVTETQRQLKQRLTEAEQEIDTLRKALEKAKGETELLKTDLELLQNN